MLKWNPTDFLECLGVLPAVEAYGISHAFTLTRHGMRLDLTVFPDGGDVHLGLWRDGLDDPVVKVRLRECDAARRVKDARGDYLEFAPGRLFGGRYDGENVIPFGIRLRIEPSFSIEFFRTCS